MRIPYNGITIWAWICGARVHNCTVEDQIKLVEARILTVDEVRAFFGKTPLDEL